MPSVGDDLSTAGLFCGGCVVGLAREWPASERTTSIVEPHAFFTRLYTHVEPTVAMAAITSAKAVLAKDAFEDVVRRLGR